MQYFDGRITTKALKTSGFNTATGVQFVNDMSEMRFGRRLTLDNCGWRGLLPATVTEMSYPASAGTANDVRPFVMVRDSSWVNVPAPSTPVPGTGQPIINQNPYPVTCYVYGGTLTAPYAQVTPQGGSAQQVLGASAAWSGLLNPGDAITLTYSGVPTVVFVPVV